MSVRLLIADDHEIIRAGLRSMLAGTNIDIVAEAGTGEATLRAAQAGKVDVVLLDVRMPKTDGLKVLIKLKDEQPDLPVLMLSTYDNPTYIARSAALGASGYLIKGVGRKELVDAIKGVAAGEILWKRESLRRVTAALAAPRMSTDIEVPLTRRESEVLRQLAHGLTNKEIAQTLDISYETVKEHVQHILRKVGVTDRTQVAIWAVRNGLL